ncbi:pyruvate kinase [Anaerocolumna cellulosilytica]|uniref:Pyruvate kinase n=1 Tax=Anaerocolumna cellulosilytica TaxID=433286 RepID=A0A6S6R6W3_9FIRM|nr:pyruvate kinase [Anaerocolumna cellulosilytica]BCJ94751.1 pyruvate kinase [Anaerocolumna cellulosilytica]
MRKTKIVCTLGPSTDREGVLRELVIAGMDVARFNFSHADHEEHMGRLTKLREIRKELGLPIAALLDTKGPEIRIGKFKDDKKIQLKKGQTFTLTVRHIEGTETCVYVNYEKLIQDIQVGSIILIDDGLVELVVKELTDTDIICQVNNDGVVSNNKGVNVPGSKLSMPFISKKDRDDIIFAIQQGYDFIAASFTRNAQDIMDIRKILEEYNCNTINIIAKIENLEGVENIDEIIDVSDGIMIARGDMGVEIPNEDVPVIQKMIIKKVYNAGKQVITATQMLDSMIKNPRPTRAETTDVANAIYDGTSAIMLSGETAAGAYPIEAVKTMDRIAVRTEQDIDYKKRFRALESQENPDITDAISHATCTTAHDLNAAMIITVTKSGKTARMISRYRPACTIIGCTTEEHVSRQLNLSWGVKPMMIREEKDTFELFEHAVSLVEEKGLIQKGELTVITAGVPLRVSGTTNLIKVHIAGNQY